jgi:flagellar FliL protein
MAAKAKQAAVEEPDDEEDGEEGTPKSPGLLARLFSLKMIIMVVGGLAVIGGGTTAYVMFFSHHEAKPTTPVAKPAVFFDVPEVLVNLSNIGGERTQYLKVKVVLELPDATVQPQIQTTMPRVMDAFQTYLRELRPSDLDGSAGLYRLKEELTRRINVAVAPSRINAVLFKEIVVQ